MLAVGDSVKLEVILRTSRYTGLVAKSVSIQTDRGDRSSRLRIYAHVLRDSEQAQPLSISPRRLQLEYDGSQATAETTFTITSTSDSTLSLRKVGTPDEYVYCCIPQEISPGKTATGTFYLDGPCGEASFAKSVTIEVNDSLRSRFTVPIQGLKVQ